MVNRWLELKFNRDIINYFHKMSQCEDKEYIVSLLKFYTAPTRLGSKIGTLVNLKCSGRNLKSCWEKNRLRLEKILSLKSIDLRSTNSSVLVYFYNSDKLERRLKQRRIQRFLSHCGYEKCQTREEFLWILKERFSQEKVCPHEVGIFLGYPLQDVIAFHENNPNFKYVGYWKCYRNVFLSKLKFFVYDLSKWSVIRKRIPHLS